MTQSEFRQDFWRQKTRVPGLSYRVVCVILGLAVLVDYRLVTHGHTMTASTAQVIKESPLPPLTDPHDAVSQRMLNIPYHNTMVIKLFIRLRLAAEYRSRVLDGGHV